jgi:hypothetical protein
MPPLIENLVKHSEIRFLGAKGAKAAEIHLEISAVYKDKMKSFRSSQQLK